MTKVIDKGQNYEKLLDDIQKAEQEHYARIMRVGRKCNDAPVAPLKAVPYYLKFDKRY